MKNYITLDRVHAPQVGRNRTVKDDPAVSPPAGNSIRRGAPETTESASMRCWLATDQ